MEGGLERSCPCTLEASNASAECQPVVMGVENCDLNENVVVTGRYGQFREVLVENAAA